MDGDGTELVDVYGTSDQFLLPEQEPIAAEDVVLNAVRSSEMQRAHEHRLPVQVHRRW